MAALDEKVLRAGDKIRTDFGNVVGYEDALQSGVDVVHESQQFRGVMSFWFRTSQPQQRLALERLVAQHLGVGAARVKISHTKMWRQGAFNLAIPVLVFDSKAAAEAARDPSLQAGMNGDIPASVPDSVRRVVLRLPMAAKCAEATYPGSILEKMRCETATYVWMQQHCPDVRIPHLYGFGLPTGKHFVHASHVFFIRRILLSIRRLLASWMGLPVTSRYLSVSVKKDDCPLDTGYMILEHFGPSFGQELPLKVRKAKVVAGSAVECLPEPIPILSEPTKMVNLFRGVSRIILSLARVPQPRIGAFRFNDDGTISLDGRPVTADMVVLENAGAPRTMAVDTTYSSVDEYVDELQTFHEQRFLAAPNAANSEDDAVYQMGTMSFLRAVTHHFIKGGKSNSSSATSNTSNTSNTTNTTSRRCKGPFVLSMSDNNQSNIMVDDDWNVTGIYDLEWIFSAPVDQPREPPWLTWSLVDSMVDTEHGGYEAYAATRAAFMAVFAEEERLADTKELEAALGGTTLSAIMEESWVGKTFFFYASLLSINGMTQVVRSQLWPMFFGSADARGLLDPYMTLTQAWAPKAVDVISKKMDDHAKHLAGVAALFGR
ncbi:hypothetical protein SCUCBS95973_009788 [Sporothrix curviconia]|uniref:Aminoglycoside phosphotransferase domain-containing protein n=1 Tax=Sporothrix curviconia TaxID=1260050 RepID=A0ABP0D0K9_9PEZI